jgi:hypothetical protein
MWAEFYGMTFHPKVHFNFPSYMDALESYERDGDSVFVLSSLANDIASFEKLRDGSFFNKLVFKKRIKISILTFLLEADFQAGFEECCCFVADDDAGQQGRRRTAMPWAWDWECGW